MRARLGGAWQMARLARQDLVRDWALTACQILALIAILTPLLIFQGLQYGVLQRLFHQMNTMPSLLEIERVSQASDDYSEAWLAAVRARGDVAFVAGNTQWSSREISLAKAGDTRPDAAHETRLLPSAAGDPLADGLPAALIPDGRVGVTLSYRTATELAAQPGDEIDIIVPHGAAGADTQRIRAAVRSIIPPTRVDSDTKWVLLPFDLAIAIERFRSGGDDAKLDWPTPSEAAVRYAGFRLYARRLADVAPLCRWLEQQGITVVSRLTSIEPFIRLDRSLGFILDGVTILASLGFGMALAVVQWASVERKRQELGLLGLIGYGPGLLWLLPVFEASFMVFVGTGLSFVIFALAAGVINAQFPPDLVDPEFMQRVGGFHVSRACQLPWPVYVGTTAVTWLVGLVGSSLAVGKIVRIDPALIIRNA